MRDKINILKALAILGVIGIHLTSNLFNFFKDGTFIKTCLITFDQLIRFSVPLFVFLSGLSLSLKYQNEKFILGDFLIGRVFKLIPLYLIWSIIIYFVGDADYHLYFVPMIFQLYLLFPLFLWFIKKNPLFILVLTFIFQVVLLWQFPYQIRWDDQHQYHFFGSWVFYFVLGIWLAKEKTISKKVFWIIPITMVWVIADTFNLLNNHENMIVATRSSKISVFIYSLFIILGGNILIFDKLKNSLKKLLIFVGRHSYLIYLSHTIIIRIIFEPLYNKNFDPFFLVTSMLLFAIGLNLSAKVDP